MATLGCFSSQTCIFKKSAQCGYIFPERPDKLEMELLLLVREITRDIKMTFLNPSACWGVVRANIWGCHWLLLKHTWRSAALTPMRAFFLLVYRLVSFRDKLNFEHKRLKAWRCLENLGQGVWIWILLLQRTKHSAVGKMDSIAGLPWLSQIHSLSFRNLLWLWISPQKSTGRKG